MCPRSEGFPSLELRCLFPELGVMCGYAVTAHVETVTHANPKEESAFIDLFDAVEKSRKPAVIVMQEIGGDRERAAHSGEVMSTIFTAFGGIGLISDCAVRDFPPFENSSFIILHAAQCQATRTSVSCARMCRSKFSGSACIRAICCMGMKTA